MRELRYLGMFVVLMSGCTCATPIDAPDARSPDVIDPLEPCALGIRRVSMDLMPLEVETESRHMAFLGEEDRLWVAQTDGPDSAPVARLTELGLDGTRVSMREAALAMGPATFQPAAIGEGEPREVLYFDTHGGPVIARFDGETFAPTGAGRVDGIYAATRSAGGFVAVVATGTAAVLLAIDHERVTRVELDLDILGGFAPGFAGDRQWSLTSPDASGRILGAVVREGGDLMAMTIDTMPAIPVVSFVETGVNLPATYAKVQVSRSSIGVVVATYFVTPGPNLRAVWLDGSLRMQATADLPGDARFVELFGVTASERSLFALGAYGASGARELRVAAGLSPGELQGGLRALGVSLGFEEHTESYTWSATEGAMSLALRGGGLEVVTLCAPL